mgnify:CR=1 FL=1
MASRRAAPSDRPRLNAPALRLRGITKRFGSLVANDGISLDLGRGEVLALLGENGAGKSTLVSILFGHYLADAGRITVDGQPFPVVWAIVGGALFAALLSLLFGGQYRRARRRS